MVRLSNQEAERIDTTLSYIPPTVDSVLEIGVHDGRMSGPLRRRVPHYVGLDLPRPVTGSPPSNHVFATVAALPFRRGAVDMVLCCEVLEHLPEAVFQASLSELPRVASRYLLITVPYRQTVAYELTRCAHCGFVGHWTSHLRSFSEDGVRDLMPGWILDEVRPFGGLVTGYAPGWLYRLKYRFGMYSPRPWPCEACRRMAEPHRPSLPGRVVQSVVWRLERRAPLRPAWLLARWKRRPSSPRPLATSCQSLPGPGE